MKYILYFEVDENPPDENTQTKNMNYLRFRMGKSNFFVLDLVLQIYENFKFVVFEFDCCRAFLHAAVMSLQPPR